MPAWTTPLLCELFSSPSAPWRSITATCRVFDSSTATASPTTPPPIIAAPMSIPNQLPERLAKNRLEPEVRERRRIDRADHLSFLPDRRIDECADVSLVH